MMSRSKNVSAGKNKIVVKQKGGLKAAMRAEINLPEIIFEAS